MRTTYTLLLLSALLAGASCRLGGVGDDDRQRQRSIGQRKQQQQQRNRQQRRDQPTPPSPSPSPPPRPRPPQPPPPPYFSDAFPPYSTTLELLTLSHVIYKYRGLSSCHEIIHSNTTNARKYPLPPRTTCHLYERDEPQDTQVMVVSRPISPAPGYDGYVAVVYAGTDDFRNVLTDGNILLVPFGPDGGHDSNNSSNSNSSGGGGGDNNHNPYVPPSHPDIRVHAGFNHAVFHDNLFDRILSTVRSVLDVHPTYQLLTTGHSLGAADSMLTAVALSQQLNQPSRSNRLHQPNRSNQRNHLHHLHRSNHTNPNQLRRVLNVNFGCPRVGNSAFRQYVHSTLRSTVSIFRFVNSVDLVPRLPDELGYVHVGHTVQMSSQHCRAYYRHDGDVGLGFKGVPMGWEVAPFVVVPYNALCHSVVRYLDYMVNKAGEDAGRYYADHFAEIGESDDDDDVPHDGDDDGVPDPPDDDFGLLERDDGDEWWEEEEEEDVGAAAAAVGWRDDAYDPRVRAAIAGEALDWYKERVAGSGGDDDEDDPGSLKDDELPTPQGSNFGLHADEAVA